MSKKTVKVSEVLELLEQGKKRPEIAQALDITMADCRKLFQHPKLKGKKPLKQPDFIIEDDTESKDDVENVSETEGPGNPEVAEAVNETPVVDPTAVNSDEAIERKAEEAEEPEEIEEEKVGSWEE